MGFFDSANPEQRQENDLQQMVELLKEIRDIMQKFVEDNENRVQL